MDRAGDVSFSSRVRAGRPTVGWRSAAHLAAVVGLVVATVVAFPDQATACDCAGVEAAEVVAKAQLIFIGVAEEWQVSPSEQAFDVLTVLKGTPGSADRHLLEHGEHTGNCTLRAGEGQVVLVTVVDGQASICMHAGSLHGVREAFVDHMTLAGGRAPEAVPVSELAATLEIWLAETKRGNRDVYVLGHVPVGDTEPTHQLAGGRTLRLIDVIDGTPADATIIEVKTALERDGWLLLELVDRDDENRPASALVRSPEAEAGEAEVAWFFANLASGGSKRIPEPR